MKDECGFKGTLPYWDWSLDSQAPDTSFVWSPNTFGGDGQGNTQCVADGPFSKFPTIFGSRGCLARSFGSQFNGLQANFATWSPEAVNLILTDNADFNSFRSNLEFGPHGSVHVAVGGSMGSLTLSSNDPIFMLHHNNVDRTWARWQEMHPEVANTYDPSFNPQTTRMPLSGLVSGELDNLTVAQTFQTAGSGPLCYVFSNSVKPITTPQGIIARRQAPSKKPLACPTPLTDEQITKMYGQDKIPAFRAIDKKTCDYIKHVNENPNYVSPASLVKPGVNFRSVPRDEYEKDVQIRSSMVKEFFKRK